MEAEDPRWKQLNCLMIKVAQMTTVKRSETTTQRQSRVSASEMYRLAYLMQDAGARTAWTKAYLSKDDRLEYENANNPFDLLAEMFMKGK